MKKKLLILVLCGFSFFSSRVYAFEMNKVFIKAADKIQKSVVNIIIYKKNVTSSGCVYAQTGYGSGTIISNQGYLITNYHVVNKGNFYKIVLPNGRIVTPLPFPDGSLFKADKRTDLALLKIDPKNEIHATNFANSDLLKVGEWVLAAGNPFGLHRSITSGIVSSKGRNDVGFIDIENFIQTDVAINPGNSGGPLANLNGDLVGINSAIRSNSGGYQGISFAIPSNLVLQVANELIKYGKVRRGWLGFFARGEQNSRNLNKEIVFISSIVKNSPAEKSGLLPQDQIISIDGINVLSLNQLVNYVSLKKIGENLKVEIIRNNQRFLVELVMREKQEFLTLSKDIEKIYLNYGLDLGVNSYGQGVLLLSVSPMSEGYRYGVKRGDLILGINGKKLKSIDELLKIYRQTGKKIRSLNFKRGDEYYEIYFE